MSKEIRPLADAFRLNNEAVGDQLMPTLVKLGTGEFAAAWVSTSVDRTSQEIFGTTFESISGPTDTDVQINITTPDLFETLPQLWSLADDSFAVSWLLTGYGGGGWERQFAELSLPMTDEFKISFTRDASFRVASNGTSVVVDTHWSLSETTGRVFLDVYDPQGTHQIDDRTLFETGNGHIYEALSFQGQGGTNFVAWQARLFADPSTFTDTIAIQLFGSDWTPLGTEVSFAEAPPLQDRNDFRNQWAGTVLSSGDAYLFWFARPGDIPEIRVQKVNAAGEAIGGVQTIGTIENSERLGLDLFNLQATVTETDHIILSWQLETDSGLRILEARIFDPDLQPLGAPLTVEDADTAGAGPQIAPAEGESFVVLWSEFEDNMSETGFRDIYGQVFEIGDVENAPPQGDVVIVGLPETFATLTADVTSVSDADGIDPDTFLFQWYRDGLPIEGATAAAYDLLREDAGTIVSVRFSYTDLGGTDETVLSPTVGPVNFVPLFLTGTNGNDTLIGFLGDDELLGLGGDDRIIGNEGDDQLDGGLGTDILNGGAGNDIIVGGPSQEDLRDAVFAGAGDDFVDAGAGNDLVYGMDGNDTIVGGVGVDELLGQNGDDVITGSAFSDLVFGGAGNDFVNGGFGSDRINGGTGADKFFHAGVLGHGSDWVQDYIAADGDVLLWGGGPATASNFQVNFAHTANDAGERAGDDAVREAFVIYRPTEQIIWALVDGEGQDSINIQINGETFNLLG